MTDETQTARPPKTEAQDPIDEAVEVAPGILRIMLPMDAPGLKHVNCYALEDDDGVALIDPGVADGVSHEVLATRLNEVGIDIDRVHTVVVTHSHFDHFGGIARLKLVNTRKPIATIAHSRFGHVWHDSYDHIGEDSEALDMHDEDELEGMARFVKLSERYTRTTRWGEENHPIPAELLASWSEGLSVRDILRPPSPSHPVDEGDTIRLGRRDWQIVHTPGHADDHVCLWNGELGVLFSGDHVLPTITPHIGGFSHHENPLHDFLQSLERMEELQGVTVVLPAHGDPFVNLVERAQSIAAHHHERLERVGEIAAELGAAPVRDYMRMLFRERSWGPLAASETFAHLEWLRLHKGATRTEVEGLAVYEL